MSIKFNIHIVYTCIKFKIELFKLNFLFVSDASREQMLIKTSQMLSNPDYCSILYGMPISLWFFSLLKQNGGNVKYTINMIRNGKYFIQKKQKSCYILFNRIYIYIKLKYLNIFSSSSEDFTGIV